MHQILGLFNFACSITSVLIMAIPLKLFQQSIKKVLMNGTKNKVELLLMSITTMALFTSNLTQHTIGYSGPPSHECAGCVNTIMQSTLVYKLCYKRKLLISKSDSSSVQQESTKLSFYPTTDQFTIFMTLLSLMLLSVGFIDTELAGIIVDPVNGLVTLYVVSMMGYLSWKVEETGNASNLTFRPWILWKAACISLFTLIPCAELESSLCHLGPLFSRVYHSILGHSIIVLLFWCVNECLLILDEIGDTPGFYCKEKEC